MTPEQIEGYLKRLDLKYLHEDEPGPNGVFRIQFETASYRSTMPPRGKKRLKVIVSLSHDGELLMLNAPYVYHLADAKKRGVFCEYLIDLNYRIKVAQFQMDRRDGEVSCEVCLPVGGSNVSFESFKRLLYVIPFVLDHHHEETWTVMKKGKLPPVPKVPELDLVLVDLVHRVGSVAKLREIVEAHEEQARVPVKRKRATGTRRKAPGKRREQKGAADGLRNPLPPACDPTKRPSSRGAAGDGATGGAADGAADGGSGGGPRGPSPA